MDVPQTERKLGETRFFLEHVRREARRTVGDRQPFRYYLSACLSASRSVTFVFQKEAAALKANYERAIKELSDEEQQLLAAMNDERVDEVHHLGATVEVGERRIRVDSVYEDEFGRSEVVYVALANDFRMEPPAEIIAPRYFFKIGGQLREVVEVLDEYLSVLERLIQRIEEPEEAPTDSLEAEGEAGGESEPEVTEEPVDDSPTVEENTEEEPSESST